MAIRITEKQVIKLIRKLLLKKRSVRAKVMMKNTAIILLIPATAALLSCSEFKFNKVFVAFYKGNVTIQKNGASPEQVQGKEQIKDDDIIRTCKKSCLVIRSTDGIIIRFEQNTEAQILSFNTINKFNLNRSY